METTSQFLNRVMNQGMNALVHMNQHGDFEVWYQEHDDDTMWFRDGVGVVADDLFGYRFFPIKNPSLETLANCGWVRVA